MENIKTEKNKNTKTKKKTEKKFFEYKGKPLVRCGNIMYYGDMNDRYIVKIGTNKTEKLKDLGVASSTDVAMIDTNIEGTDIKKIVKMSKKHGLYEALDIANIWLERALAEQ